jgi:hypothetical protein
MLRLIVNVKVSVKVKVLALVEGSDWRLVFASQMHSQCISITVAKVQKNGYCTIAVF